VQSFRFSCESVFICVHLRPNSWTRNKRNNPYEHWSKFTSEGGTNQVSLRLRNHKNPINIDLLRLLRVLPLKNGPGGKFFFVILVKICYIHQWSRGPLLQLLLSCPNGSITGS